MSRALRLSALVLVVWTAADGSLGMAAKAKARSTRQGFVVRNVQGPVISRLPFEQVWRPVKQGKSIPRGALLQVEEGGRIAFDSPIQNDQEGQTRIDIKTPIVARFDEDLVRRVEGQRLSLEVKEEDVGEPLVAPDGTYASRLREAWEKVYAMLGASKTELAAKRQRDIEERRGAGIIDILRPTPQSKVVALNPAEGINVVWKGVNEPGVVYDVKVWPETIAEPMFPTARTVDTSYMVKPARYGKYYVSVTAASGKWQSKVITFELLPPEGQSRGAPFAGRNADPGTAPVGLQLLTPPDQLKIAGATLPYVLDCSWKDHAARQGQTVYEVTIKDLDQKVRARLRTLDQTARVHLPAAGIYTWQVVASTHGSGKAPTSVRTSDQRLFELKSEVELLSVQALEHQLRTPGRHVVVLEKGL